MRHKSEQASEIQIQAASWHTKIDDGKLSAEDQASFDLWINEKAEHKTAFDEINVISDNLQFLSGNILHGKDTELGAAIREAADLGASYRADKKKFITARYIAAIAASLLVVIGSFWLWQPPVPSGGSYQTAIGEQRTVMLQDGSMVTLNTNSEITVAMTEGVRRLHLIRGEVYFDVAKDKNRPFEVAVENAYVVAVGTAFNIKRQGDKTSVLVTEGVVEVKSNFVPQQIKRPTTTPPERKETLVVGEQIIFGEGKFERLQLENNMIDLRISWRKGKIFFDEVSLSEVVEEIQPYMTEKIVIADEDVGRLIAGGMFNVGKMNSFFNALETALPVEIVREKGVIIIMRRLSGNVKVKQNTEL